MIRSFRQRFLSVIPRALAVLTIVVAQSVLSSAPARGQAAHATLHIAYVRNGNIWVLEPGGRRLRLTGGGHDSALQWTSDGQALLFQREIGSKVEAWRWQPGVGFRQLQNGMWSPDGTAVAITRTIRGRQSATTVWVKRQGRMVQITPSQRGYRWYPAAWSPNSSRLALTRYAIPLPTKPGKEIPPSSADLWVTAGAFPAMQLSRVGAILLAPGQPGWPDIVFWSPDGRFLTVGVGPNIPCASCRADGRPYYAVPAAGGRIVGLGTGLSPDLAISWSSDGSFAVLSGGLGGRETYVGKQLFRVDLIDGKQHALSRDLRWADIEPAVSPDGKYIAFARGRAQDSSTHLMPVTLIASRHLFLMGSHGGHPHQLVSAPGWTDEAPVWSPDGQWLLFVRWRSQHSGQPAAATLWAVRADGTGAQRVAQLGVPAGISGFGYYGAFGWKSQFSVAP